MQKKQVYLQVILHKSSRDPKTIRFKTPLETTGSDSDLLKLIKSNAVWSINLAYVEFTPVCADVTVCLVNSNGNVIDLSDGHVAAITQKNLNISRTPVAYRGYNKEAEAAAHPYWVMEYSHLSNPD